MLVNCQRVGVFSLSELFIRSSMPSLCIRRSASEVFIRINACAKGLFGSSVSESPTHSDKRRMFSTLRSVRTPSSLSCCNVVECSKLTVTRAREENWRGQMKQHKTEKEERERNMIKRHVLR